MENGTKINENNMESTKPKKRKNPNVFSRMFICWVCPVLINGNKRNVEEEDLITPPSKQYDSHIAGEKLEKNWLIEVESALQEEREPSLWTAIVKTYWLSFMPGSIYVIVQCVVRTIQPLVFAELLNYWVVDTTMTQLEAGLYALALILINFISALCQHHNNKFNQKFAMKIKVACSALLYRKMLRINQISIGETAAGKLVNLLSNDVARFDYAFMFLHSLWVSPIQVAVVLYLLWESAGYAPYVGLFSVVLVMLPAQSAMTRLSVYFRRKMAGRTDRRIKLMNEIINGIQVIKMYAWEKPFEAVVSRARASEVAVLKNSSFVRSAFIGFMMFIERTILFVTCLVLILSGQQVTATVIYPIQQYFSIIQFFLTMILPMAIFYFSEMKVSIERIQSFLVMDEKEDASLMPKSNYVNNLKFNTKNPTDDMSKITLGKYKTNGVDKAIAPASDKGSQYAIELSGVSASWTADPTKLTLNDLTLQVPKGRFWGVIGPVASGKSSLLQVLLRELNLIKGSFNVQGTVSYASQDAWLFPATVRENITFGLSYDAARYRKVCDVCCLTPDFKQFPYGDLSLVGERGVSLSGGQRARINLARAVYRDADVYLLDDPLSAVDANVGRQLFEGCINGYLKGKTVILVTHQVHFLNAVDKIVVLNEGAIENIGTFEELSKSGKEFALLMTNPEGEKAGDETKKRPSLMKAKSVQRGTSVKEDEAEKPGQTQAAEERATGTLKWAIVQRYLSSVNSWCVVMSVLLMLLVSQGAGTATDYWLSYWTNSVNSYMQSNDNELPDTAWDTVIGNLNIRQYIGIYGGLCLAVIVFLFVRIAIFVAACIRASQNLHNTVFKNMLTATMRFFDTNPSGRVLNRFSKDLGAVDELLPRSFLETIQTYLNMTGVLVLNAIALPYTLVPTAFLVIVFALLFKWYLNAAQSVKRLEGTTKSPVFGKISSTLAGLATIRSSGAQEMLLRDFDAAQDLHSRAYYTFVGGSSAFGMYLDLLCIFYLSAVLVIFIFIDFEGVIPVGSVGMAVSQSMVLTMLLQMAARFTADFLAHTTSVERVLEYSDLQPEKDINEGKTPPKEWPTKGKVTFENVFMKYSEDADYVLKNLNFEIKSGWKVGVVGRTGAGKSSLISALFRLYDMEGSVKIDGVDTSGINKLELRSKITIIPQEPVLFSATLRYNLDPFDSYSDDEIWRALEQVELKDAIPALDFKVSEGGSNFSVGQRQLVCLARAILRSNKILIMDEATANVDPQTDALIQNTIRKAFASCTVITIAHRLNTIIDSDRVLVMDKGQAVEFDTPYALLNNPRSVFTFMVKETGDSSSTLFQAAKDKYMSDQNSGKKDN
ncbi:ABC transporter transmembrane region domain-containing protein [Phthorimaea operculella]|nr:ABC transporter transmembrane region domain-containing protein [Phthorimaea operculella]